MKYTLTPKHGDVYEFLNNGEKIYRRFDENDIKPKSFVFNLVDMKIEIETGELPGKVYDGLEKDWNVERSRKSVGIVEAHGRTGRMSDMVIDDR